MKSFSFYRALQDYFLKGKFGASVSRRDRVRMQLVSNSFLLKDNRLFYTGPSQCYMRLVVLSEAEKRSVLMECHSNPGTGRHNGIRGTRNRVIAGYYWPTQIKDVTDWVKGCQHCQLNNTVKSVSAARKGRSAVQKVNLSRLRSSNTLPSVPIERTFLWDHCYSQLELHIEHPYALSVPH